MTKALEKYGIRKQAGIIKKMYDDDGNFPEDLSKSSLLYSRKPRVWSK